MATQLPRVQRMEPLEPTSVGRVDVQAPDLATPFARTSQALTGIGETVVDQMRKAEEAKIDLDSNVAAREFEEYAVNLLDGPNGVTKRQGDPTQAYEQFDTEIETKRRELLEKYKDANPRLQGAIIRKLEDRASSVRSRRNVAYGNQYHKYDEDVTASNVKLGQKAAMEAVGLINPTDPRSFDAFDKELLYVRKLREEQALRNGSASQSEDGKITFDPVSESRLMSDLSDTAYNSIDNALSVSRTDIARVMIGRYGLFVEPSKRAKLEEKMKKEDVRLAAFRETSRLEALPFDVQRVELQKLKKDPEIFAEVTKQLESTQRHLDNLRKDQDEESYNRISKILEKRNFNTVYDFENDPLVKKDLDRIQDAHKRKALRERIEQPKKSDQSVKANVYRLMEQGEFKTMTYGRFAEEVTGLNEEDRKMFETQFRQEKMETASEERSRIHDALVQLERDAIGSKLVRFDSYTGKVASRDQIYLNDLKQRVVSDASSFRGKSSEQVAKEIRKIIQNEMKVKFSSGGFGSWFRSGGVTAPDLAPIFRESNEGEPSNQRSLEGSAPTSIESKFKDLSSAAKMKLMDDFNKANGRPPATADELLKFFEKSEGGQ